MDVCSSTEDAMKRQLAKDKDQHPGTEGPSDSPTLVAHTAAQVSEKSAVSAESSCSGVGISGPSDATIITRPTSQVYTNYHPLTQNAPSFTWPQVDTIYHPPTQTAAGFTSNRPLDIAVPHTRTLASSDVLVDKRFVVVLVDTLDKSPEVRIVGNCPALGSWEPKNGLVLTRRG